MADLITLIAGNICAGKTTLTQYVEENKKQIETALDLPVTIFTEFIDPVARKRFYNNPKKHAAKFESSCLTGRIFRHEEAKETPGVVIFDRGMIEGAETFCWNSYRTGILRKKDYDNYINELYDALDDLDRTNPSRWLEKLIVYLEINNLDILEQRNQKRAHEEHLEQIPRKYLGAINSRYQHFIDSSPELYSEKYAVPAPQILPVNAEINFNHNPTYLPQTLNLIIKKMKGVIKK